MQSITYVFYRNAFDKQSPFSIYIQIIRTILLNNFYFKGVSVVPFVPVPLQNTKNNKSVVIDSHCHLDFNTLTGDLSGVLSRAKSEGVSKMLTIGTNFREITQTISLSESFEEIFFATGIHPNQPSENLKFKNEDLLEICKHQKMIGIGETGLDFHYSLHSKKAQIYSLIQHIEVAREANLPVIIHARNADKEIGKILYEQYLRSSFSCVMHCFSSSSYLAEEAIELGFYLSMSGIITFKNSHLE